MTMTNKKRDRCSVAEKTPQPSRNRRDLKTQRNTNSNEKIITKDTEMKEPDKNDLSKDKEVSTDLLRKFDKANVDWKRWITLDEVKGWELSSIPEPTAR
jgi:hypothetical protein